MLINAFTAAQASTTTTFKMASSSAGGGVEINLPLDQQQTNDDVFETLFESMRNVANSQPGEIPFDSPAYVSILNALTGEPSNDNNDDGKSPLN